MLRSLEYFSFCDKKQNRVLFAEDRLERMHLDQEVGSSCSKQDMG